MHDLSENDANRLLTKLHDVQIEAAKEKQPDGRYTLNVDGEQVQRALKYLDEARIFRDVKSVAQAKSGLISSREDQRFHYERALSSEIETTLLSLDDVLEARVHLNMPPTDPLFGHPIDRSPGSASVLLVVRSGFGLREEAISGLVSGASGIKKDVISVIFSRAVEQKAALSLPATDVSSEGAVATALTDAVEPMPLSSWWQRINLGEWVSAGAILVIGITLVALRQRRQRVEGVMRKFERVTSDTGVPSEQSNQKVVSESLEGIQMIESLPGGIRR